MIKQIKSVSWKIKVGDKEYGDGVTIDRPLNSKHTGKATREEIKSIIKEAMEVLTEQAISTIQMIITGKEEGHDIEKEAKKDFEKKVKLKRSNL